MKFRMRIIEDLYNSQCSSQGLSFQVLDFLNLCSSLLGSLIFFTVVPMDVLVLLPSTCRSIDTVTEIVLKALNETRCGRISDETHLSVFIRSNV